MSKNKLSEIHISHPTPLISFPLCPLIFSWLCIYTGSAYINFITFFLVLWKPIFRMHPQNISTYLNDGVTTVTLKCAADGFPRPVISWLENSSTVINESVIQNGSISSLVLTFRARKKTPKYRCMARNSLGRVFSKETTLTILERPTNSSMEGRLNPSKYHNAVNGISRIISEIRYQNFQDDCNYF